MRLAIIVPRYGPDVLGGAESLARGFAQAAVTKGWQVEVWTTCAHNHYTWDNVYPAGTETYQGIIIRRFPVTLLQLELWAKLAKRLALQGGLWGADPYLWLEVGPHSPLLYQHIVRHASDFDILVALPYAAQLVHYAAWIAPERTVIWPCLHNEPYAYIEAVHLLLENVWGVMFNSPENYKLATKILGIHPRRQAVLGEGVTLISSAQLGIQPSSQTLLYVGRLEEGKNLPLLYKYVRRYADEGGDIHLAVVGRGPIEPPNHPAFEYRGFVSEEEKARCYASALALCQPSLNESFSLTTMESWLAGRPVLVHEHCEVTRGHVQRSKGGLWFNSYDDFVGAVIWLQTNPELASQMGRNGRNYVQCNYTWSAVVDRLEGIITTWQASV